MKGIMAKAYSVDLRQKIVDAYLNKQGTMRQLAEFFKISKTSVNSYIQSFRKYGNVCPKQRTKSNNPPRVDKAGAIFLSDLISMEPDLTLEELCNRFESKFEKSISTSSMDRFIKNKKITRKKKLSTIQKKKQTVLSN